MKLNPRDIRYSQDSIRSYFRGPFGSIYQLKDDIISGKVNINEIPCITVAKHDGEYYTFDNRRLWVFKQVEQLGCCSTIDVDERSFASLKLSGKFTTVNGGKDIIIKNAIPSPFGF